MSGSGDGSAPQTPAWKKLGLKLKNSNASESANGAPAVGQPNSAQAMQGKRKFNGPADSPLSAKKSRNDARPYDAKATPKRKSVSFAETPSRGERPARTPQKTPAKPPKKPKGPPKKKKEQPPTDVKPALEYLRHWQSSRDSWKFNKNHQSTLIKAIFDGGLPAEDVESFYEYIRDLKGFVRTRLRETAMEIRAKDISDGATAFPSGTLEPEAKQATYETALAGLTDSQRGQKRAFDEVEYVSTSQDVDAIIRRIVKRMRAELVIATLSDGAQTDVSTPNASGKPATAQGTDQASKTNMNGVTGKRRRKLRTNMDDSSSSSSSSESDSDSDSDSSTSGSSSSDESSSSEDEDMNEASDDDTSSSSSSSSSDDSDSDDSDSDDDAAQA